MNKTDIITKLNEFPYSRDEYWVITGTAMVLYGIREATHDIDMGCTSAMADKLEAEGYPYRRTESGNRSFKYGDDIEIFENWIYGSIICAEGIPVISIDGLIEMKQELGREKDFKDIALIKVFCPDSKIQRVKDAIDVIKRYGSRADQSKEDFRQSVKNLVEECLDKPCFKTSGVNAAISEPKPAEADYSIIDIVRHKKRNYKCCIVIFFTKENYVAVVGAGADLKSLNYDSGTGLILKLVGQEWDAEKMILVELRDVESAFRQKADGTPVDNILSCRDGIENYIGDYLESNGIPILNYHQHRNYPETYWEKVKNNNFRTNI